MSEIDKLLILQTKFDILGTPELEDEINKLKIKCEQNEKLRKIIIDCADLWDGKESSRYGDRLNNILKELGITEIPDFYSKENMDKVMDELDKIRKKKK